MSELKIEETSPAGTKRAVTMEKLVNLCKRRGIVFPASEIYGGLGSTWDYGPLGIELKRNVKEAWWRAMVTTRSDVVGLDSAILQHPRTWEASGHLQNFTDPLVDCKSCKQRFRADHVQGTRCPECGGELTEARSFNLMFKTFMGPVEDSANVVYLRPETAQGIFLNFANIVDTQRVKLPFGVAQTGKSFRNEITPGNFIFRTREFEQMEMEFFVKPDAAEEARWFDYWVAQRFDWYVNYGVRREHLKLRPHEKDELSHYSRGTTDVEYLYPFGWGELEGIAKRGSFDLDQHAQFSGKDLTYFDEEAKARYRPWVIEPAAGVDRAMLAFMLDAYDEDVVENEEKDRAPPRSTARPGQGRRLSAAAQGRAAREGAGSVADAQAAIHRRLRSGWLDRAALSSPGRGGYAVRHYDRSSDHGRRHGNAARPRFDRAGAIQDRGVAGGVDRAHRLASLGALRPKDAASCNSPLRCNSV